MLDSINNTMAVVCKDRDSRLVFNEHRFTLLGNQLKSPINTFAAAAAPLLETNEMMENVRMDLKHAFLPSPSFFF